MNGNEYYVGYLDRKEKTLAIVNALRDIANKKDLAFYSDGDKDMRKLKVCFVKDHKECWDSVIEIEMVTDTSRTITSMKTYLESWLNSIYGNELFMTVPRNCGRTAMLDAIDAMRYAHDAITNKYSNRKTNHPEIEKVIFNDPATIVLWKDGTKTVVKAVNEPFDKEKGLTMAIAKKVYGNEGNYYNEIKKWTR